MQWDFFFGFPKWKQLLILGSFCCCSCCLVLAVVVKSHCNEFRLGASKKPKENKLQCRAKIEKKTTDNIFKFVGPYGDIE